MDFQAPVAEITFTMKAAGGLDEALATGAFPDLSDETVEAILAEAGRFATVVLAPLNRVGDRAGTVLDNGTVATPPGWKAAYRQWAAAGWSGIGAPLAWGGQGLPVVVEMAVQELWNAANPAFATGPMLTAGAIEAIGVHAEEALKRRYLPRLVGGDWMATMNLTEPHAGSDLGAITTRAEPAGDDGSGSAGPGGGYRIWGQKIFITHGEHDLTENIIHLVLARLPDAPAGTAGISMFLVPKIHVGDDGSLGRRNDVIASGVEHKLGLNGSPTCTMVYGEGGEGAIGWLVGEENRGLAAMFTMMNRARLAVGVQGVGVAERAYGQALAYARERRQGRAPGASGAMGPIIDHPDVQRDLLGMKALAAASRAICHATAHAIDMSRAAPAGDRARWGGRAGLLTPVAKAFSTDAAIEVASTGIQVHGGAGYIEETGAAQYLRDARVFAIYEGTNGIQAIDLVARKLRLGDGEAIGSVIAEVRQVANDVTAAHRPDFGDTGARLATAANDLAAASAYLAAALDEARMAEALSGATPYLRIFGLALGGALLAKGAMAARAATDNRWTALARFFAEAFVGETTSLAATVVGGAEGLRQAAGAMLVAPGGGLETGYADDGGKRFRT